MNSVKTKAGTELPLRDLKGKRYLDVCWRVLWMREEHPDWEIHTEYLQLTENVAVAKATIKDGAGKLIAQGTKMETPAGFADYVEKCETGAIGRALAHSGYGTQFTMDLEDGERLADSPVQAVPAEAGAYVLKIGKDIKNKRLDQCDDYQLAGISDWISKQPDQSHVLKETRTNIEAYLKTREVKQIK